MTPAQLERWHRIEQLALSPPDSVVSFSDKLMQATGWTRGHCERAITEYRRFLLLAAEAGHPVSPSPDVDEVWHLHLLYTRSYWDDLCPNVLGFRLHHEPATGTTNDRAKLDDWYARTLSSYQVIFGEAAPSDVWAVKPAHVFVQRVDPTRSVVLSKGMWYLAIAVIVTLILALIVAVTINSSDRESASIAPSLASQLAAGFEAPSSKPAASCVAKQGLDRSTIFNSQPEVTHVRDYEPV